ncbi:S8 family serine peptidase [Congregibacter variabilis]|uniref:S8 family serine peptidase n=1 Tax=Congregibacter variabilis TaxID=3081200 RepID=A0ABZ0I4B0_9GAMM|nr:S8 family serine peptidase [Congregibacter sp. IMCC43200]
MKSFNIFTSFRVLQVMSRSRRVDSSYKTMTFVGESAASSLPIAAILFGALLLLSSLNVSAQLPVGGFLGPDPVEAEIDERVEQQLEKRVEDNVEENIENVVEIATELNIQENIEDNIEETIEQTVDASVEGTIDDAVAQTVEERLEESVESSVEMGVAEAVESSVEEGVEVSVEEAVAATVEESVEAAVESELVASVESDVEASVEESVAESVEASIEETVADAVAGEVEGSVEDSVEATVESSVEDDVEQRVVLAIESRLENEIDEILDGLESDLEVDEGRILKEQWLVMAEPVVFEELTSQGYLFDTVTELPGLGLRLAEVAAPSTFDITQIRDGVLDVVGKDRAEVDLNHIYTAGVPEMVAGTGVMPRAAMSFPSDLDTLDLRVGMIDSRVDTQHPALVNSSIHTRSFARPGAEAPEFHGTAIASIIAANSPEYQGLAPMAEVYAASVFELDGKRGEIASTVSLIRALDWLISSGVDVVNISLAGPPNRLLERALDRASSQDMVVMAAAGNGGPVARPMYPAAYDSVVAVTAVDSAQQVFRLANRGEYLALAAPGVDLRHAQSGGGYAASSGTSFAVPFAVTAAARLSRLSPESDIITMLLESAMDLGPPGRDTIYGYGLLTLGSL